MVYTNPPPAGVEASVTERGPRPEMFAPTRLQQDRVRAQLMLHVLRRYTAGRRLLDIGAGAGVLVHQAVAEGWDATGLDLNGALVETANQRWQFDRLVHGTIEELAPRMQGEFDVVTSNQVFEHIERPREAAMAAVSVLSPGGVFYVDVPNVRQPGEWLSRGKTLDPTSHLNHFARATLRRLLEMAGCRVLFCSASPSLINVYHKLGLKKWCCTFARLTRSLLPPVGTGVCAIGRRINGVTGG